MSRALLLTSILLAACEGTPNSTPWLDDAHVLVKGQGLDEPDCRTKICRHNENTDLLVWKCAIYLVHRTAQSQALGPNSSLRISRSTDEGKTWELLATLPAPKGHPLWGDRDQRDPTLYVVGNELYVKALIRLPVTSTRDSDVDTRTIVSHSTDGKTWTDFEQIGGSGFSFWRIKEHLGGYYAAAYEDGDQSVVLFASHDGKTWTRGPLVYGYAPDTPLETELSFLPSGLMLALVRMDGLDQELDGGSGRLRTKICWSAPPYAHFDCPDELRGQRLDGPVSFFWQDRLFVVARKHLPTAARKRTSLFEITGNLEGGPLGIHEHGELPSAGDTSYAGIAPLDENRFLATWYSTPITNDEPWTLALFDESDIWQATLDLSQL